MCEPCDVVGYSFKVIQINSREGGLLYVLKEEGNALGAHIRDLKQARTATVVNKQLNFTVKDKPRTTNYIYCIFEAYFMMKSVWKNYIDCFEVNRK